MAILNNQLCPNHLNPNTFLPLLKEIVDQRVYHKKRKKESKESDVIQAGLKIAINSIYGLLNSKTFWLFDPQITFTVTINNQLMIMMLIEKLELAGYHVISANTDGIVIDDYEKNLDDIRRVFKQWEALTNFTLEETFYQIIVRRDVNNYLAKTTDGTLKLKGLFEPQGGLIKGFTFPVIAKALQAYFLEGIDPKDFIENHDDILDFCAAQKISAKFTNVLEYVKCDTESVSYKTGKPLKKPRYHYTIEESKDIQPTVRYYVCQPDKVEGDTQWGYRLRKRKIESGKESFTNHVADQFIQLFNNVTEDRKPIDKEFYLGRIQQEINKIESNNTAKTNSNDNDDDNPEQMMLLV